jgi:type IV pilus assembly protein PilX
VLIIALIMLTIISLLATFSMRNAGTSEKISGNTRTTQMAQQAAEIALRYCEDAVVQTVTGTGTLVSLPTINAYSSPPNWKNVAGNWDVAPAAKVFVLPSASVNAGTSTTYPRFPECMVESMQVLDATGAVSTTSTYVITARGFGPEVAAVDNNRSRPVGSEVWLQSSIGF